MLQVEGKEAQWQTEMLRAYAALPLGHSLAAQRSDLLLHCHHELALLELCAEPPPRGTQSSVATAGKPPLPGSAHCVLLLEEVAFMALLVRPRHILSGAQSHSQERYTWRR